MKAHKQTAKPTEHKKPEFAKLLAEALDMPGQLSDCYRMFYTYSFANQILAMSQLFTFEPINTYNGWNMLGRQVMKGSKAIELCMPFQIKTDKTDPDGETRTVFGLSQTEAMTNNGRYDLPEKIKFNKAIVLANLLIHEVKFESTNGNMQGYSLDQSLAINPVAQYPLKTLWHELAHIMLGHTDRAMADSTVLPRNLREVEAETVAYILCGVFEYTEPMTHSRGYIQHWNKAEGIPEDSAKRIFKTVTDILKANQEGK